MRSKRYPVKRSTDVVTQEVDKEVLIYDLGNHNAYCLNETSALIYQMCDGDLSVSDITKKLSVQLRQPVSEDLVWLALDQLEKDHLLEPGHEIGSRFDGPSRRDVIRQIGLASVIALPLISSVVAPPAANAASGAVCTAAPCTCAGTNPVASCAPAPGVCQAGCNCKIADPVNDCVPDGFGGVTCTGKCG